MAYAPTNNNRWAISIAILFLNLSLLGCGGGGGSASNTANSSAAIASLVSSCSSEDEDRSLNHDDSSHYSHCSATYTVSYNAGSHGTIKPNNGDTVNQGGATSFTVTPDAGYAIESVSGCGGSLSGNIYTTGAITADCTVTATFSSIGGTGNTGACTPPTTTGTPWVYPCEISVAKAYNTVFLTAATGGVPYDETSQEGLADLLNYNPIPEQQTNWTAWHSATSIQYPLTDVTTVSILVNDTSSQMEFGLRVENQLIPIYDAKAWTPPSRGWINDPMGTPELDPVTGTVVPEWSTRVASIPDILTANNLAADSSFTFYVKSSPTGSPVNMDISNTHRIESNGTYNGGFLLAYEDDGSVNSDHDYNDLIVYVNSPYSAPGGCMGFQATMFGTPRSDYIQGTFGNDVIMTFGGNDVIYGSQGDDIICSGDGNDLVYGGLGKDIIYDGGGRNNLNGGPGADTIYGGNGVDAIFAGGGDDIIYGNGGNDNIFGDSGNDTIYAGGANDKVLGFSGNDTVHGGDGNDQLYNFVGTGTLYGDGGDDLLWGDAQAILLDGGDGINKCLQPMANPRVETIITNCQ